MKVGGLSSYSEKLPVLFFIGSLLFFSFAFGAIVIRFQVFPFSVLDRGFDELKGLTAGPVGGTYLRPVRYVVPTCALCATMYRGQRSTTWSR